MMLAGGDNDDSEDQSRTHNAVDTAGTIIVLRIIVLTVSTSL